MSRAHCQRPKNTALASIYCFFPIRQLPLVPPSPGSVSLETWLVVDEVTKNLDNEVTDKATKDQVTKDMVTKDQATKDQVRVELCQRLEYAKQVEPSLSLVLFPTSALLLAQPSSILPFFPAPSSSPGPEDEREENDEFVFPDAPIQPLAIYEDDQDQPLHALDFVEEEEESETGEEKETEKLQNDLGDELEVNFEIASIEDLVKIEKNESAEATNEAEDEPLDMGEMFNMADNIEEANEPTEEEFEVSSSAEEEVAIHGNIEIMEDDNDRPSEDESDAGSGGEDIEELGQDFEEEGDESSNVVGGTALFDSIDLMRQAVEFLTVTK